MGRVVTYRELIKLLPQKINEPASDGQARQRLTTNGAGVRSWTGSGLIINADRIRVNGIDYVVRTGESGAAGYLTIGENTLWLGVAPFLLDLGGHGVKQIYKGTSLAYEKASGVYTLFDSGWVDGINWGGNLLPRPQYKTLGRYDFSHVDGGGYMDIYIEQYESNVTYYTHVCTADLISIPADATKLKVSMMTVAPGVAPPPAKFGLLTDDCINSMDATNGGVLSGTIYPSYSTYSEYELNLLDGMAGTSDYRVVINNWGSAYVDRERHVRINKVWFE